MSHIATEYDQSDNIARWHVVAVMALSSVLIAAYCHFIGLNMMPLRGESGLFIAQAWGHGDRLGFIQPMLSKAYNGHFTPLFFGAEFLQAGLFGMDVRWWFARQMLVLGLLATSIYLLSRSALAFTSLRAPTSIAVAGMVALLFVVQPTVLELTTWPFMAAQLLCIACGAMATANLLKSARNGEGKPVFWALGWGYASMHMFGVGFTISASIVVASVLLTWARRLSVRAYAASAAFGLLTLLHAAVMARSAPPSAEGVTAAWADQLTRLGALYLGSIQGGARSLWANGRFPWPNPDSYPTDAVYGLALLFTLTAVSLILLWRGRQENKPILVAQGIVVGLFTFSNALYSVLIVVRLQGSPDLSAINPFLFGTRYLIFSAFFIFLLAPGLLISGANALGKWLILPTALIGWGAAAATMAFFATINTLWPIFATPFPVSWTNVVHQAQTDLSQDGYIHNRALSELDPEFHAELSQFSGVLEKDLGCTDCVRFSP